MKRGPTDPFFDDMMLQTVGPGYQGGMMMDGSAKIAQDTRERQIVSVANKHCIPALICARAVLTKFKC